VGRAATPSGAQHDTHTQHDTRGTRTCNLRSSGRVLESELTPVRTGVEHEERWTADDRAAFRGGVNNAERESRHFCQEGARGVLRPCSAGQFSRDRVRAMIVLTALYEHAVTRLRARREARSVFVVARRSRSRRVRRLCDRQTRHETAVEYAADEQNQQDARGKAPGQHKPDDSSQRVAGSAATAQVPACARRVAIIGASWPPARSRFDRSGVQRCVDFCSA